MTTDSFVHQIVRDMAGVYQPNGLQRRLGADFYLVVLNGDASVASLDLTAKSHVDVGRSLDNDLVVRDATCSRHHFRLTCDAGVWFIEDRLSRNGTHVNGTKIHGEYLLCNGDEIQVGQTRLQFTEIPQTDI